MGTPSRPDDLLLDLPRGRPPCLSPQRPRQNRVTPTGEIVRDPGRGLLMGNRGCLHGSAQELGRARWRSKHWICCVLRWRDVRRDVMPPGRWTALFFLDEATALAAGHRPCAYCRRADFLDYAHAWGRAIGQADRPRAAGMDTVLHRERLGPRPLRSVADLPDGVMVRAAGGPALVLGGRLVPWSFGGYGEPVRPPGTITTITLITPQSTVDAIVAGYRPWLHPSVVRPHGLRTLAPDPVTPPSPA